MAKTSPAKSDQIPTATPGKWVWREESFSLEFVSFNITADKNDRKKRGKGAKEQENTAKKAEIKAPAIPPPSSAAMKPNGMTRTMSRGLSAHGRSNAPRSEIKITADHTTVTLEDVKTVSLEMLAEVEVIPEAFDIFHRTAQLDDFLLHLLAYFHCFFEKTDIEARPKNLYIEPSLSEKKAYADACGQIEMGQKLLGQSYCVLVLGLGLEQQHHMACGHSRVSSTYKDRSLYETFYSFCTLIVWITFRRKEYETVRKEIGRMLRSDTFNPAIRVKNAPEEPKDKTNIDENTPPPSEKGKTKPVNAKQTPAEYRRLHGKRPAIRSIINQRSPAVVSILPSPKEESLWLFRKTKGSMSHHVAKDLVTTELPEFLRNTSKLRVGILGEPLISFNLTTLTPVDADNEDDEENEDGQAEQGGEEGNKTGRTESQDLLTRQQTAVSQVTTEVFSDNEDDEG